MKLNPRYTELDKNVTGSGADAVSYLPKELQQVVARAENIYAKETHQKTLPSGVLDWREGVRLTKGHINADKLKYADLFSNLRAKHLASSQGTTKPEFSGLGVTASDAAQAAASVAQRAVQEMEEVQRQEIEQREADRKAELTKYALLAMGVLGAAYILKRKKKRGK